MSYISTALQNWLSPNSPVTFSALKFVVSSSSYFSSSFVSVISAGLLSLEVAILSCLPRGPRFLGLKFANIASIVAS